MSPLHHSLLLCIEVAEANALLSRPCAALWIALRKLGYSTYHMAECNLDSVNDSLVNWDAAIQAKMYGCGKPWAGEDFDKMLWNYDVRALLGSVE